MNFRLVDKMTGQIGKMTDQDNSGQEDMINQQDNRTSRQGDRK